MAQAAAQANVPDWSDAISDADYAGIQRFIHGAAGITLGPSKRALVVGRLGKRLAALGMQRFGEYLDLLRAGSDAQEVQTAIDLLTTNETYFFREPRHFDLLRERARAAAPGQPFRVWSAASSSGEEAYSCAMVLADVLGPAPWEVLGTDISTRVLHEAARGVYRTERARQLPDAYLKRYCLRGTDDQQGRLLIHRDLRNRVRFGQLNLDAALPEIGPFDVVFLRNVMIYFSDDTKRQVVQRVLSTIRRGGVLCVGHSESLNGLTDSVRPLAPSVYLKPA